MYDNAPDSILKELSERDQEIKILMNSLALD